MTHNKTNYYHEQLKMINCHRLYSPKFKLMNADSDAHAETNWIDLNEESARELFNFLQTNFPNIK